MSHNLVGRLTINGKATLSILLGIGSCWLWFGSHVFFIFSMDSAIFGGILILYGIILFAKNLITPVKTLTEINE